MPAPPCEPYQPCTDLDARLLISNVLQGPALAWDTGEISLGNFTARGAVARPYVDIRLEQTWVAKEACYRPVRSIFSLAPGEQRPGSLRRGRGSAPESSLAGRAPE